MFVRKGWWWRRRRRRRRRRKRRRRSDASAAIWQADCFLVPAEQSSSHVEL